MTNALIHAVIDAADDLIAAHDGTTDQFESEVARLSAAVSALERASVDDNPRACHANLTAISASLHTHDLYARFYERMCDRLSGFTGIYDLCIAMAGALTAWEMRNGGPVAYESLPVGWIEVVEAFVHSVILSAIADGDVPDLEGALGGLDVLEHRSEV